MMAASAGTLTRIASDSIASGLDSAQAIARLLEPVRLVSGGEMAEWLKATVC